MPFYNWMGVSKATLEAVKRYVAKEVGTRGIRSNLVAAGPVKTLAAKAIAGDATGPGAELNKLNTAWDSAAPIGWDVDDPTPVAKSRRTVLSDWLPAPQHRSSTSTAASTRWSADPSRAPMSTLGENGR